MGPSRPLACGALAAAAALMTGFAPAAAPSDDVCALLSAAEMGRVIGRPVASAVSGEDENGDTCTYAVTPDGPRVTLTRPDGSWNDAVAARNDSPQDNVYGLGAAALWAPNATDLLVRSQGGAIVLVSIDDDARALRGGDAKGVAMDVARAVLARMK
ncbi:hypothetical protein [Caulobacter sp. 17J80-11]|uniref:hypothetical protein n=1 Tax=Caulobacter sp. 17J80-11 TaxID=2763502 RepID=UPI001653670E|nr:hypothetical protein [Caulobacter sp. 17J80-11]MBC6981857.1 hypothetical protein [Caulobacter sp. 17J80-11]